MIRAVLRAAGDILRQVEDMAAGGKTVVTRRKRHFETASDDAHGRCRNPLAVAIVAVTVATELRILPTARRIMRRNRADESQARNK